MTAPTLAAAVQRAAQLLRFECRHDPHTECDLCLAATALEAAYAESVKDSARLDCLADQPVFDGLGELDLHETAHRASLDRGENGIATNTDYRKAFRVLVDAALSPSSPTPEEERNG